MLIRIVSKYVKSICIFKCIPQFKRLSILYILSALRFKNASMDLNNELSYQYTPEQDAIPYQTIPEILKITAKICPEREAVVFLSTNGSRKSLKYVELYEKATLFAKGLLEKGIVKEDVVAISNQNCPEWLVSTLGVQMAGAIPLHFFFKNKNGSDVANTLRGVPRCTAMIIDPGKKNINIDICKNFICLNKKNSSADSVSSDIIVNLRNFLLLNKPFKDAHYSSVSEIVETGQQSSKDLPFLSPDDIGVIFLTSGSTGIPKAIPVTYLTLLRYMQGHVSTMGLSPGTIHYNDRPFSWQVGYPEATIICQATLVTASDIMNLETTDDINNFMINAIEAENCVSAVMMTTCMYKLLHSEKIPPCKQWPLNVVVTGGVPVESTCAKCVGTISKKFVILYGSTEVGMMANLVVKNSENYEDYNVGYPAPGVELKIVDENGKIVPRGTVGEICSRSRDRFLGYINAKEKNAMVVDRAGWYKTDDVGIMLENGCSRVTGRKSDIMIIGEVLVSSTYLENIIKKHPNIFDAYVYPLHKDSTFHCAYAAVEAKPAGSLSEEELRSYVLDAMTVNKNSYFERLPVPEHFIFYDALPRTHNGKLDRKATAMMIQSTKGLNLSK